jgi:pimeloyl-ACP methyl ester carboxylesterase
MRRAVTVEHTTHAVQESTVEAADGTSLHVQTAGHGQTVLLIHGLGYAAWAGIPLRNHLVDAGYRYLTFDNRGTGGSDKPQGPYTITELAVDAAAVVRARAEPPVHVIGYSLGGYIALQLALVQPETVASLTLIATSAGGPGSSDVPEATREAWAAATGGSAEDFARATMPISFRPGWTDSQPEAFESILKSRLEQPTPEHAWQAQYDAGARHIADGLDVRGLRVPALVLHGTDDRVVPHANGVRLANLLPDARFRTLAGAGHLSWFEDPEGVSAQIIDFLTNQPPTNGVTQN